MEPKLSLAPSWSRLIPECSSSESSDTSSSWKRKVISDSFLENESLQAAHRNIIDLQHSSERLPLDWEQCLDLKSGKMYFLNRKTLKKSWDRPTAKGGRYHHQYKIPKLDLELTISSQVSNKPKTTSVVTNEIGSMKKAEQTIAQAVLQITDHDRSTSSASVANYNEMKNESSDNMEAMACMSCHMLVIVSTTSPTCPNCKFIYSCIPTPAAQHTSPTPAPRKPTTFKPLETLTFFS